jgi:hypothetical protein
MFFFVGGVSTRLASKDVPRPCPACGAAATREERSQTVLSLFFLPILTLSRSPPLRRFCESCGWVEAAEVAAEALPPPPPRPAECWRCGAPASPGFRFCPQCGVPLQ